LLFCDGINLGLQVGANSIICTAHYMGICRKFARFEVD
jgi:hypothetical protein